MRTLVANVKGGCGKSTLAINLAVQHAIDGARSLIVDTDPQRTAEQWATLRADAPHNGARRQVDAIAKRGALHTTLPSLDAAYDQVVIDSGGRDTQDLRAAALIADLLILPVMPAAADLWATNDLVAIAEQATVANPRLLAIAVLVRVLPHPQERHSERAREYLQGLGLAVADTIIHERMGYRYAFEEGLSVTEWGRDRQARRELMQLHQELYHG